MFNLNRILDLDAVHRAPATRHDCLGDSYLCAKNPIHRRIRDEFIRIGGRYVGAETQLWEDYQALPLLSLSDLLRERVIPVVNNTRILMRLADQHPEFEVTGDFLCDTLRRNYLLHESAHCVADAMLSEMSDVGGGQLTDAREQFVFRAVLSEAFALSAERLAWAVADSPTHMFFYVLNSYSVYAPEPARRAAEVTAVLGASNLFRIVFTNFVFLFLKACRQPLTEPALNSFIEFAIQGERLPADWHASLQQILPGITSLAPEFRDGTSSVWFRLQGCEQEFLRFSERKLDDAADLESLGLTDVLNRLTPIATAEAPALRAGLE